jgi:hypothetical protein
MICSTAGPHGAVLLSSAARPTTNDRGPYDSGTRFV